MDNCYRRDARLNLRSLLIYFVLAFFVFLNGCSTVHRKDGPPDFYVDETKIPDAVPKVEPLSRIGNQPSYVVHGHRYYVMRSSKSYHERGIASWYGTLFHAHHTSNGERYDMLAMTAAHKSLPLPTYVEVTNLQNHKKIIVKVNDRGPFESNRIIDLSYVAAKKLGMLGHGTAYVDIKAIDPAEAYRHQDLFAKAKNKLGHSSPSGYYLQVGAFKNRQHAEKLKEQIVAVTATPVNITRPQNLFKVQVGPFRDTATAARIDKQLKSMGLHAKQRIEA